MKKGVFSIICGIISLLGTWKWGISPPTPREFLFWIFFAIIGICGLILGTLQLKERKFFFLSILGIIICLIALIPLLILILGILGIFKTVA